MKIPAKQYQALTLLSEGERDKRIAVKMNLKPSAVRATIHRAVKTVGAKTRCHAIALFVKKHQGDGPF